MLTWKVWDDEDLLFEGTETEARAYAIEQLPDSPALNLESPDGDFYRYRDGSWLLLGDSGLAGADGAPNHF